MKVMKAVVKCTSAAVKNWISWCPCAGIIHLKYPIRSYFVPSPFYKAHFTITEYPNPILLDFSAKHTVFGDLIRTSTRHNTCLNSVPFTRQRTTKPEIFNQIFRLRVVPHISSGIVERAKREHAWKSPHARKGDTFFSLPAACRLFSRGVIFTPARVSIALLSLRKNGGLLVVYQILNSNFFQP